MNNDSYTLELTSLELYWLASAWGFTRLPLIQNPFQNLLQKEVDKCLNEAQISLLRRGLIRPSSQMGWEIENVPAELVRWIASAEYATVLEVESRTGETLHINIYHQNGTDLSLLHESISFKFTLYQLPNGLQKQVVTWIGAENTLRYGQTATLPPKSDESLIRAAWRGVDHIKSYLNNSGWDDASFIPWLEAIDLFANFTLYQIGSESIFPLRNMFLVRDGSQIWKASEKIVSRFIPVGKNALEAEIKTFCEANL